MRTAGNLKGSMRDFMYYSQCMEDCEEHGLTSRACLWLRRDDDWRSSRFCQSTSLMLRQLSGIFPTSEGRCLEGNGWGMIRRRAT